MGLFLYGEKRLSPRAHWWSAVAVFLGSWLSGYFIIATDAWMQHPVGYAKAADGSLQLSSFWALVLNPWAWWQYAHNMSGAVITGAIVMASVGAFYLLWGKFEAHGRIFVRVGVIAGLIFSVLQLFPTGDGQGRMIALNQPVTLAAMEALFVSQPGAPLIILGQPNVEKRKIDNPLEVPDALSFLTYRAWKADVKGWIRSRPDLWPDNISLLYYSYHIMVGLGTIFIAIMVVAAFLLWRGKLFSLALDAVDFNAHAAVPLHRKYGWMVDGRAGAAAVAGLRPDAHGRRILEDRIRGQRNVYAARLSRHVYGPRHSVSVSGAPRN